MPTKEGKVIVIDEDKCTGCHSCEIACSLKHYGICSPHRARIKIQEFRDSNTFVPLICQACEDSVCIKVCPMNARNRQYSGSVITDEEKCIGCRACVYACPFGTPVVNPDTGKSMTCDKCINDESGPWCARACGKQGALKVVDENAAAKAKARGCAHRFKEAYKPSFSKKADQK